jgi:hypothetical protein
MTLQKILPYNMNSFTWSKIMYAWTKFLCMFTKVDIHIRI